MNTVVLEYFTCENICRYHNLGDFYECHPAYKYNVWISCRLYCGLFIENDSELAKPEDHYQLLFTVPVCQLYFPNLKLFAGFPNNADTLLYKDL